MYDVCWLEVADDVSNLGIEIPGTHFQDQKYSNDNNWKIITKQNVQSIINRKSTFAETVIQMTLRGNSKGLLRASQGGLSGLSPLRSDGSQDSQMEAEPHEKWSAQIRRFSWWSGRRLDHCEAVAKDTQVHSGQMVHMVVRQGGWTKSMVAEDIPGRVGKWF
jgi:hypothetical protein